MQILPGRDIQGISLPQFAFFLHLELEAGEAGDTSRKSFISLLEVCLLPSLRGEMIESSMVDGGKRNKVRGRHRMFVKPRNTAVDTANTGVTSFLLVTMPSGP